MTSYQVVNAVTCDTLSLRCNTQQYFRNYETRSSVVHSAIIHTLSLSVTQGQSFYRTVVTTISSKSSVVHSAISHTLSLTTTCRTIVTPISSKSSVVHSVISHVLSLTTTCRYSVETVSYSACTTLERAAISCRSPVPEWLERTHGEH